MKGAEIISLTNNTVITTGNNNSDNNYNHYFIRFTLRFTGPGSSRQ